MSVLVVGLSHQSAPVSVLELVALSGDAGTKLLQDAADTEHLAEAVVLATCNRVEVYAEAARFHAGLAEISELLARHTGIPLDGLTPYLYVHYEQRAVAHLYSVACGLESMVVGEGQILGQVRAALARAQEVGTADRVLNELFQQALRIGKRAHTETDIDRVSRSIIGVGLDLLDRPLAGARALVIGAGSMSALAAATLRQAGATELVISNRTVERAQRLADQVGGTAIRFEPDDLAAAMATADVVVTCTGARQRVLTLAQVRTATAGRPADRPLAILDVALPRDTDPEVRELPGVRLVDLDLISRTGAAQAAASSVDAVRRVVGEEVAVYSSMQRAAQVVPTVVALRSMAADLVDRELKRLSARRPELDQEDRAEIAQTVHRVVGKLLHGPTVRVKELAGQLAGRDYAEALRELFDLDLARVEAVSRADMIEADLVEADLVEADVAGTDVAADVIDGGTE
ncbi:MAG: glutamyl-tRNA reductase [Sporichthyaceae bacterium]|nr:glutamyl-tRNA reductase [Sporichthyaceae bacterium]